VLKPDLVKDSAKDVTQKRTKADDLNEVSSYLLRSELFTVKET